MRNALTLSAATDTAKMLVSREVVKTYGEIVGGAVAGSFVPRFVLNGLQRVNLVSAAPGTVTIVATGIGSSVLAGTVYGMITKSLRGAVNVAGGALAATVGQFIIVMLEDRLPSLSGLGQDRAAVRRQVESEIRKQIGLSQFLTTSEVEEAPSVSGVGQFLTEADIEAAPGVSGLGADVTEGAEAFDGFDGGAF